MTTPDPTPDPWSDDRLGAAFAALAAPTPNSADSLASTIARLRERSATSPLWRRLLPAAAVIAVAIGGLTGGVALLGGSGGTGLVEFRGGPTPDLRTLDAGDWAFDFRADWLAYDATTAFSGGSSIAVLGTQAVEPRCGGTGHVDINCVYEQPLGPGDIRIYVGTGAYRGGTVLDRPDIENGTTTRLTVGGMPALLDAFDPQLDSFYQEDISLTWVIGYPRSLSNVVRIEVRAREWPFRGRINTAAEVQGATQALIDSFRFTPPPTLLPSDAAAAAEAARTAIRFEADAFRRGYVGNVDSTAETYLECPGDEPLTASRASVLYGPGGALGRLIDLACTWTIREETPTIWRLDLTYEWTVDGRSGRYIETRWLDASATVIAGTFAGDPLPAIEPGPVVPTSVFALPVIDVAEALEVRDAGVDDRELAVRGWFSPIPPIECPAPATWPVSPVEPNCPDQWVVLMAEPESLFTIDENGFSGGTISGPAIRIDLDDVEAGWQPALPDLGVAEPVEIVAVGHFDDRRSLLCPDVAIGDCRDRFVVDRVDWVNGTTQPLSVVTDSVEARVSTPDVIRSIVEAERPADAILSMALVDGEVGVGRIEPSLGTGQGNFIDRDAVWVVRVLQVDQVVTYLVIDGSDAIYEVNDQGFANLVGGTPPPLPVGPTEPPDVARSYLFPLLASEGPTVEMEVDDVNGTMSGARSATLVELALAHGPDGPTDLQVDNLDGDTLLVRWGGSVCDSAGQLVVYASTVTIDGQLVTGANLELYGNRPPCDAMGIGRGVVLEFSMPVKSAGVRAVDLTVVDGLP